MAIGQDRQDLEQVDTEKDLGVIFQSDLHFRIHIAEKVKKANSMLGIISRCFRYMDDCMFKSLYKSLVRPHVEYAAN